MTSHKENMTLLIQLQPNTHGEKVQTLLWCCLAANRSAAAGRQAVVSYLGHNSRIPTQLSEPQSCWWSRTRYWELNVRWWGEARRRWELCCSFINCISGSMCVRFSGYFNITQMSMRFSQRDMLPWWSKIEKNPSEKRKHKHKSTLFKSCGPRVEEVCSKCI